MGNASLIEQSAPATKRQLVDIAEDEAMTCVGITPAAIGRQIIVVLRRGVAQTTSKALVTFIGVDTLCPGVAGQQGESACHPAREPGLQRIVIRLGVRT